MRDARIGILAMALCLVGAAKTPTPTPVPPDMSDKIAAQAAAEPWLKLVDSGQYGESWDAASEAFKKSLTRKQWEAALTKVRSPLGDLVTRKFRASQYFTDLPVVLVGFHMLGAALISASVTWVLLRVRRPDTAAAYSLSDTAAGAGAGRR